MDKRQQLAQLLMQSEAIPLPRPDPRGPVVPMGQADPHWRNLGPDGQPVEPVAPQPPAPPQYGWGDHITAALRAMFEGEKYREQWMRGGYRDSTGLYDRKR